MRKGGGMRKGGAFERQIAKDIVKAFKKHGIKQRECWRSTGSGGHTMSFGDLEISDRLFKLFPYIIECKFRRKIKWQNFMLPNNKSEEQKWVKQTEDAGRKAEKAGWTGYRPILVMKENFGPIYVKWCCDDILMGALPLFDDNSGPHYVEMTTWKKFLTNAVKEANKNTANART